MDRSHFAANRSFGDSPDTDRQAYRVLDPWPGRDQDRAGRCHLVQIAKDFYLQFAFFKHIALAGQVSRFRGFFRSIGIQGLMTTS